MTISAGWYPDPAEPSVQRYWDGDGWVGASMPVDATPPDGPPPAEATPAIKPQDPMPYGARSGATGSSVDAGQPTAPSQPASPPSAGPAPSGQPGQQWQGPVPGHQPPGLPGYPGSHPPPPIRPLGLALASPGARLLARLFDIGAVLLLNVLVNGWFVYLLLQDLIPLYRDVVRLQQETGQLFPDTGQLPQSANGDGLILVIVVLAAALWFAYEVPATANTGQTLGKRILKIKVVPAEGDQPIGFGRSWARWTTMGLPVLFIPCCAPVVPVLWFIDSLMVATDSYRRMAIHDRRAQTYVVQLAPERKPS
jgi:uncharacterized RDD family membrane protein YckC